jgi:two-component system sensor histidine kinase AlgZ
MHPIFRNKAWLVGYLVACAALGGMLAALLHVLDRALNWTESLAVSEPLVLFFGFVCLTPWYVCRQLPLASAGRLKISAYHASAAVLATCLWIALARAIGYVLHLGKRLDPAIPSLITIGFLFYLLSVALHYVLLAMEASRQSALEAREAELRALKAQINPHFLFNSLNSISALTASDPARARDMCICLGDFLRRTLGLGERESIMLREELDLAQTYLEVEKNRFGERLQVEVRMDERCNDCLVPPLILQPLVENAIKHGIATMVEGGTIMVESQLRDGMLRVKVENGFDLQAPRPRSRGMGLRNVRRRLEARFGSLASLSARPEGNRFLAEVILPYQTAEKA